MELRFFTCSQNLFVNTFLETWLVGSGTIFSGTVVLALKTVIVVRDKMLMNTQSWKNFMMKSCVEAINI